MSLLPQLRWIGPVARTAGSIRHRSLHTSPSRLTTPVESNTPNQLIRVRLYRSLIGLHKNTRKVAESMGLCKVGAIKTFPVAPNVVGNLVRLKEIIKVELVNDRNLPSRSPPKGYQVVKKFNGDPYVD
ncbi:hypothetical protein IWQ62_004290 [Dispira parvispora]|uniref:Large ribosomal subunit protein uL30-like ferredoxin-like fold domain-containing protein n=1 Tax=Dispira parvispora TaxID=1520584 RepID=A0A9W8E5R4_9FUNG|nr:hypothetical protein IWQ62_004290 [Dispira parvispora]